MEHEIYGVRYREHRFVCARALGHVIPPGAEVFHVDRDNSNNQPGNLVLCQSRQAMYDMAGRAQTQAAGGDPWSEAWCKVCKRPRPLREFTFRSRTSSRQARLYGCRACLARLKRDGLPPPATPPPWSREVRYDVVPIPVHDETAIERAVVSAFLATQVTRRRGRARSIRDAARLQRGKLGRMSPSTKRRWDRIMARADKDERIAGALDAEAGFFERAIALIETRGAI